MCEATPFDGEAYKMFFTLTRRSGVRVEVVGGLTLMMLIL